MGCKTLGACNDVVVRKGLTFYEDEDEAFQERSNGDFDFKFVYCFCATAEVNCEPKVITCR